ncbi:MAG: glycoside hydrolase family 18 protein [Planctomycetes bacterium]|nr:glycoside hydrolase family 18 protein [Planctomycetota bacterium]
MGRYSLLITMCLAVASVAQAREPGTPESLHQSAYQAHRDTTTCPNLIGDRDAPTVPLRGGVTPRPCATVFGYLPYWEDAEHLRYELLTHVACFGVNVNSDGSLGNDHGWPWTALINQAHDNGVKVILVAVLFDNNAITTLINNETYKSNFFLNIRNKMAEGSADGLNIDFESGGDGSLDWQSQIHYFMADLTAYLHAEVPDSEVTFAGPAVNWGNRWNLPALADSCDGIFIMGYAFYGSWSSTSGPNAPLTGGSYNITNTVLTQYGTVTQNNPEKLILGVPYYGNHWTTISSVARSTVIDHVGSTRFYNDEPNSQTYGLLWDSVSQTPWYRWHDGSYWHQVWFDNADSLGLKYDLALDHDLQGVGMWALEYDGAREELWNLLDEKLGGCYIFADFNGDGHVNFDDVPPFFFCMNGPDNFYTPGHDCVTGDADEDFDVDLNDFAVFQQIYQP